MLLQASLNGSRAQDEHGAVPVSPEELARDAAACVAAGAAAIHLHPRGLEGRESLDPALLDAVVTRVRDACGVPVGVSTGAWIEPSLGRRLELVSAWTAPDYASVNLSEPGCEEVMATLLERGIGVEAGVWSVEDAERLAESGLAGRVTRVLVELIDLSAEDSLRAAGEINRALDRRGIDAPRLQHGEGDATWVVLRDAVARGFDTRIGFEDTLRGPHGAVAAGNEELVRAARSFGAGA